MTTQEHRPDFRGDLSSKGIRLFFETSVEFEVARAGSLAS